MPATGSWRRISSDHTPMDLAAGADGVKAFMTMLWTGLPDCHATIHHQYADAMP